MLSGPRGIAVIGLLLSIIPIIPAMSRADHSSGGICSIKDLRGLCPEQLEQLFACAEAGCLPVGRYTGKVLVITDARCPYLRARLASSAWRGKIFDCDASFVNQWLGFRAIRSCAEHGTSWCDGRPCIVMEYQPGTPIFGNVRDEIREIAPGLYLGRFYERCPCPKCRGYFALELRCKSCKHSPCDNPGCFDLTVDR